MHRVNESVKDNDRAWSNRYLLLFRSGYLLATDDTVLAEENLEEVNNWLNEWRLALGVKVLGISRNKTGYTEFWFEGKDQEVDGT